MAGQWAIRAVGPLGRAGRMQRIAEQDERGVRRTGLGGGQARDATAVRVAADGDVAPSGTTRWNAGTASSARRLAGRSPRRPRPASSPSTNGAMLADVPLAPCPR